MGIRIERIYTCDCVDDPARGGKPCDKEIRTQEDGILFAGSLSAPDRAKTLSSPDDPSEWTGLCWKHFHQLFPSPEYRYYQDAIAASYTPRGGPGDR